MILELQGYKIEIPDAPSPELIDGYHLPKEEQYFRRPYQLTDDEFLELTHEEKRDIVFNEGERCRNGYWFMNYGEPFWLTGDNYFFLTYWVLGDGNRPFFIKNQSYDFYFYRYCELDPKCFGSIELKPRQEGSTAKKQAILVNRAIRNTDKHIGIQSKTGDDASKVNFGGIQAGFTKLPFWMKPKVRAENTASELVFGEPPKRYGSNEKRKKSQKVLNTRINHKSTSIKGYDGSHLFYYVMDEFWKWPVDAYNAWFTVRNALGNKFRIWGKAFLLSTMGIDSEEEKISEKSLLNGYRLWMESDPNDKLNGYTKTGLYRWFIPAWASKIGDPNNPETKDILDKYGNVDEVKVRKILLDERNNEKDPIKRKIIIRQEPMTVAEALETMMTNIGSTFINIQDRLISRKDLLDNYAPTFEEVQNGAKTTKWIQGNFDWVDNVRFSKAHFRQDDEKGRFKIAYLPEMAGMAMRNRVKQLGLENYTPFGDSPFVVGLDPVEFENVQYGEGSRAAFLIKCLYNHYDPKLSYVYCAQYFARPDIPTFYEDVYKALFFYGAKINIERQVQGIFTAMKSHGLKNFLMKRPDSAKWNRRTMKDTDYGTPTSPKSIQSGLELIENYFSPPDPERNENERDNINTFWFEDVLKQLLECDPKNMTKFDLASAMIQTELASQVEKRFATSTINVTKESRNPLDFLFPVYRNNQVMTHKELQEQEEQRQSGIIRLKR